MIETFGRYNDSIEQIDVKGDKVPDGFNENQIKEKAKNYVEKRLQEGISKEGYDKLLKNIKELLERQDIERQDLIQELRQKEIGETRESVDKEAMIQEAKTMIYEKLGINENQAKNSKIENFLKGIVDELVIGNYELAIEIYNTNGKVLIESLKQLASWEGNKERLEAGSFYLQRKLIPEQEKAILEAHNIGIPNKDSKFDIGDLRKKYIILEKAGFNDNEIRTLMEKGICGKEKMPSLNSFYSHLKYSFLEKYKEVLGENLSLDDIVGEGTQAIIIKHPTNEKLVVKIAKPGEVDDIMKEFHNHNLFYEKWKNGIKNGLIDDTIKVPKVQKGEKDGYFFIEKVDGQSLYSKTLIDRFSHKLSIEDLEQIGKLDDKQVREFLKKKLNETDSYLDQIIEDYSLDNLMELLGNTYKIRKETGKIGGTPLDNAIKALRESGIAHNDLHPGNIMIDSTGNIYMIDFGRIKEFSK